MRSVLERLVQTVRDHRVLSALILAHLALKAVLWPQVNDVEPSGDEVAYRDAAGALANLLRDLVRLRGPDVAELQANVVSNGWFMPGSPIALTPLYALVPDPSVPLVRFYVGVLTSLLLVVTAIAVHRVLGPRCAWGLMVFPGLVPMWVLFSFTTWGDLAAGLVIVLVLVRVVVLARTLRAGEAPSLGAAVGLGLLLVACLYLRSSALPLVLGTFVLVVLGVIVLAGEGQRRRGLLTAAVSALVFVALLAPWSVAASHYLGARVVTTTTVPLSLATTFGDPEDLCFGPCAERDFPGGGGFGAGVAYSRELSALTGESELAVQQQMQDYALRDVTAQEYAVRVAANAQRYALNPAGLAQRLSPDQDRWTAVTALVSVVSTAMYAVAGLLLLVLLLDVRRRPFELQVTGLLVSLFAVACFVQPLVHVSHARYWPVFAPLMGLAAALVVEDAVRRRTLAGAYRAAVTEQRRGDTALRVAQLVTGATVVGAVGVLSVLGWAGS